MGGGILHNLHNTYLLTPQFLEFGRVLEELVECARCHDPSSFEDIDSVKEWEEMESVYGRDNGLILKLPKDVSVDHSLRLSI